jgi:glucose-6-phosphate 1-dehydrogenase
MDAYERVLGDALAGDSTLFARQDYVEEAWRIVDPALRAETQVYEYDPGTWGPNEVEQIASPEGGWVSPVMKEQEDPTFVRKLAGNVVPSIEDLQYSA